MTINRYTMGEAKLLYANDKEIVPAHEYDALAAELAGYKESHDKYCPGAARIRELEADLAKYQACRVRDVDEKAWLSKRMSDLEAALREIRDGFLPDGSYSGRPIYEIAPFTLEREAK